MSYHDGSWLLELSTCTPTLNESSGERASASRDRTGAGRGRAGTGGERSGPGRNRASQSPAPELEEPGFFIIGARIGITAWVLRGPTKLVEGDRLDDEYLPEWMQTEEMRQAMSTLILLCQNTCHYSLSCCLR